MSYTVIYDANELVTGPATSTVDSTTDDADGPPDAPVLSVESDGAIVIEDGEVTAVGSSDDLTSEYPVENADNALDASGQCVLPGFVDPHTHAVFAGDRSDGFEAKLRGKRYQEILADGGGILRTVRAVREASEDELTESLLARLDSMLAAGTTTLEIKSGYGLDTETELKLLAAIGRADERHPIDITATFMGAHAVPDGTDAHEYTESVIEDQLPAVEKQGVAEFCDVFCEADVFAAEQSHRIPEAGTDRGLTPKIHIEEFENLGGSEVASAVSAASADHLLQSTPDDIDALLEANVTPVLILRTAFGLGGDYPSLEPYRERDVIPALGSDFNPNCYANRMGFAATLACIGMGMTPGEALRGITDRGAAAINRFDGTGTLEVGAPADLVVLEAPSYRHLPYRYDENVVGSVLKDGNLVVEA